MNKIIRISVCIITLLFAESLYAKDTVTIDSDKQTKYQVSGTVSTESKDPVNVSIECGLTLEKKGEQGEEIRTKEDATIKDGSSYNYNEDYRNRINDLKKQGIVAKPFIRVTVKGGNETHVNPANSPAANKGSGKDGATNDATYSIESSNEYYTAELFYPESPSINEDLDFHVTRKVYYNGHEYEDDARYAKFMISILYLKEDGTYCRNFYQENPTTTPIPVSITIDTINPIKYNSDFMHFESRYERDTIYASITSSEMIEYKGQIEDEYPKLDGHLHESCYLIVFEITHWGGEWDPDNELHNTQDPEERMSTELTGGYIPGPGSGSGVVLPLAKDAWKSSTNGVIVEK